jgi:hypothetical protein
MPHLHHPDSNALDRLLHIGSKELPQNPNFEVMQRMEQESGLSIEEHRSLWLKTQPIGPLETLLITVALIFLAYAFA